MNLAIPLATIGGRGSIARAISIPIQRQWNVDESDGLFYPSTTAWAAAGGLYTSGYLSGQSQWTGSTYCQNVTTQSYHFNQTNTVLIWKSFNGTQTVLTDVKTHGQPMNPDSNCNGADRGTVFQSSDGSGLIFVASSDVHDGDGTAFGSLIFRNGARLIFDNSIQDTYVHKVEDQNGNLVQFAFQSTQSGGIYTVTDPNGRQLNINETEDVVTQSQDVINYPALPVRFGRFASTTHSWVRTIRLPM